MPRVTQPSNDDQPPFSAPRRRLLRLAALPLASALLDACGGGGPSDSGSGGNAAAAGYSVRVLASDTPNGPYAAPRVDPRLVNGWGLAMHPAGLAFVSDAGSAKATMYDGEGEPFALAVSLQGGAAGVAAPTGLVFNREPRDFLLHGASASAPAVFLFATLAGTLSGWAPALGLDSTITVVDRGASGSVYTGLALARRDGTNLLYAADFGRGKVDVFDAAFAPVAIAGAFADPQLPPEYSPFGIQAVGDRIHVAYAVPDPLRHEKRGAGLGALVVYDTSGMLIRQLVAPGSFLDAPWGIAQAPAGFGSLGGALLVGNFGDGRIHAFDPGNGAPLGALADELGKPIVIEGLWGIAFGSGPNGLDSDALFFAAGPAGEAHGAFGRIDAR